MHSNAIGVAKMVVVTTTRTSKPAFLMPPPDFRMPTLEAELRRVRATQGHQEMDRIVAVLRRCFELTIEPH